jgi:hypothetical protein
MQEDLMDGSVELPYCVTPGCQLISLGRIVTDRPGWHNARYIYPAGYKTSRLYTSPLNPNEKMIWYRQIIDDGQDVPLFSVPASGDETATFTGQTPTAPWARALKELSTRPWNEENDAVLEKLVETRGRKWKEISTIIGTFTDHECKNRWTVLKNMKRLR